MLRPGPIFLTLAPNVTPNDALNARLSLAREAARRAGELVMGYFDTPVTVERKADNSPVTIADRQAERLLREQIETAFPDDAILGEEQAPRPGRSGYRWILDPIDGTKSFIAGVPLFGTLVAVQEGERAVIGVLPRGAVRPPDHRRVRCPGRARFHPTTGPAYPPRVESPAGP